MTVRLRLTLWYTALLSIVVAGFAVLVYVAVDRQLAGDLGHAVELRAVEVAQALATAQAGVVLGPVEPLRVPTESALADRQHYVQVVSRQGEVLASSHRRTDRLPVSHDAMQIMLDGQITRDVLTLPSGERLALYGTPLLQDEAVVGVILVAAPLRPLEQTLARLRALLVTAVLGTMLLAGGIGWLLATAAMRPVDSITAVAQAIGRSGDLSSRLPPPRRLDELGRLTVAFNELLARLDMALSQQRRFLADASHELRTPLTTIRANAGALLQRTQRQASLAVDGPVSPSRRTPLSRSRERGVRREGQFESPEHDEQALRAIAQESERMGRLVNDLLALARADAGQQLARRPLMLDALLVDVYQQARRHAAHLRLTIGELEQVEMLGDPDRLRQLLLNLVDNACRYTPAGGTVSLSLVEWDGCARVAVSDTGPGIAPDDLPRIFERFFRVDDARSREAGGTGLGLAISQVIAEAHGGRIEVASQVGAGSTFTVALPTAPPAASASSAPGGQVLTRL